MALSLNAQSGLTPKAERGREIYERGTSSSGRISALLGGDSRVAGPILPCANCHGHDGRGKPEGGIYPSNITWDALTKPYRLTNTDGRTHPPYTERLFARAITTGIDPGGHRLDLAMPRFHLSPVEASDLVAYLKELADAQEPGVTATTVRLGVLLPSASESGQASAIERQTLADYFARVNQGGGIFGRRIELSFTELPRESARRATAVRNFLFTERVLAVLGDFSGAEAAMAGVMHDMGTPAIAELAPFPQTDPPLNRFVFYLDGGVEEEAQALLDFASARFPGLDRSTAICFEANDISREAATWLQTRLAESGRRGVMMSEDGKPPRADVVYWVRQEPQAVVDSSGEGAILLAGSLVDAPIAPISITGARVFVALGASSVEDPTTAPRNLWDRATASASIMTEGMKRAGRELSRAALLEALEGFHEIQTNLPAPMSYGPNRRVGASGVRIMTLDRKSGKLEPISGNNPSP
jgi:ABC-type branched-subunit amino acid transport system substrate-binding protein